MSDRVPLSVVVATTGAWPEFPLWLDRIAPQVAAFGGEILVADGGAGADRSGPPSAAPFRSIRKPGADVFALRATAITMARGEIIATTEDHCIVREDWCEQLFRAFAHHPLALAVTGPVVNDSRDSLLEWRGALSLFGSEPASSEADDATHCPPNANIAYRRSVFPTGEVPPGWVEHDLNPRLFRQGRCVIFEGMVVSHVRSHRTRATAATWRPRRPRAVSGQ